MKTRYRNVTVAPDRHGKLRARYRKAGRKAVYMKLLPDQKGFKAEYDLLVAALPQMEDHVVPQSVGDLVSRYYRCADFRAKGGDEYRRGRRGIIESFRAEYDRDLVSDFTFEHVEEVLLKRTEKRKNDKGRWVGGQVAATNLREELVRLFRYAKKLGWISSNPVDEAEKVGKQKLTGFYSWTEADIATFKKRHAVGTAARLALEIMLWTGQRRSDARLFGPKHIVRGKINFTAGKNQVDLWLPIAPDLKRAIDAMPKVGLETYLITEFGKTFSRAGFGNRMRDWCDQAGLPLCTAHGLRKAIARRAAETEATNQGLKAVGGWKNDREVSTYTESANQERLADATMARVITEFSDTED